MQTSPTIGWIYDKAGNLVNVSAPVKANLQPVVTARKTITGSIPDNVGVPLNKWDFNHRLGEIARPTYAVGKRFTDSRLLVQCFVIKK